MKSFRDGGGGYLTMTVIKKGFKMQYQSFMPWANPETFPVSSRSNRLVVRGETENSAFLSLESNDECEERAALRWRTTVLRLSDHFTSASAAHPELSPILMEALGNALEQLLLFGRARDLDLIIEWLDEEIEVR